MQLRCAMIRRCEGKNSLTLSNTLFRGTSECAASLVTQNRVFRKRGLPKLHTGSLVLIRHGWTSCCHTPRLWQDLDVHDPHRALLGKSLFQLQEATGIAGHQDIGSAALMLSSFRCRTRSEISGFSML